MPWQSSGYILVLICQDSEYGRVLNMQELHRVLNMPQYGWIYLSRTWICLNMSGFTIMNRFLNMYHIIHCAESLYKLMSIWEKGISEPGQRSKMERFRKIIIVFNYFCKKSYIFESVLDVCRVLTMAEFWNFRIYERVLNIH